MTYDVYFCFPVGPRFSRSSFVTLNVFTGIAGVEVDVKLGMFSEVKVSLD